MDIKKLMLISLLFLVNTTFSQTNFIYDYDVSGNRIKREVIVLKSQNVSPVIENDSIANDVYYESNIIEKGDIKIFPNPTKGLLRVDINHSADLNNLQISIINMNGQIIYKTKEISMSYTLDISSEPKGAYILTMQINDKNYQWKIIKE